MDKSIAVLNLKALSKAVCEMCPKEEPECWKKCKSHAFINNILYEVSN